MKVQAHIGGTIAAMAVFVAAAIAGDSRLTGIEQMTQVERLPLLRPDVQVHYEGSIDKRGGNADWDWWLYQDAATGEWVILDVDGPGCLWNFVVHHSVGHSDPVYRFYLDGSPTPAFEIKHSEFGSKPPFVAPLADRFLPTANKDARLQALNFQIVRSFCPMPFARSCRVTSSVKLEGNEKTGGGWGQAIYHTYPTADGVKTFTGKEDYTRLLELWRKCGQDPKPQTGNEETAISANVSSGATQVLFAKTGAGSVTGIRLQVKPFSRALLGQCWLRIVWDGENTPAVDCPIGAFFGNELGYHGVATVMQGMDTTGSLYSYWPMPFWKSARIELVNRAPATAPPVELSGTVTFKPSHVLAYPRGGTGHFRASAYQPMVAKSEGRDSFIAALSGSGHVVAGVVTADHSMCEGDVRVHIDGGGTPAVESDGSESWACYGWGFEFPPQANPASSYDGTGNAQWSMLRLLLGDCYPFRTQLRMTVEGGSGDKRGVDPRSGVLFWYGEPAPAMRLTDTLDVGQADSEKSHGYVAANSARWELTSAFEGEFADVASVDDGRSLTEASEFTVKIAPDNRGVFLRRKSDQLLPGQRAVVYVDGQCVTERNWYYADRNPHARWLEDQFLIPAEYTRNKQQIRIRIEPVPNQGRTNWNECLYQAWSLI